MENVLELLEINNTFFVQFVLFVVVFAVLANVYFRPFLRLFEKRHQRTVEDRKAAEKMLEQANSKLIEYQQTISRAKADAKSEAERILAEARQEESTIIGNAREEAKRITQEAAASAQSQKDELKKELEKEVETLAQQISDRLLVRKG